MEYHNDLDAKGLLCPLPVLKLRKRLGPMTAGEVIRLATDDPAAIVDVPHFCAEQGHEMIEMSETPQGHLFYIRKS